MGMGDKKFVPAAIYLLFQLFILSKHGIVEGAEVPPFDIKPEAMRKYMGIEDGIKFDVPALYAFGDSFVDSGNTMILNKIPNVLPYGIDFNHSKPTGRATNGRTMLDFLAQTIGFPFPSTFLAMSDAEKKRTRTGINFASGGSGIIPITMVMKRKVLCLDEQINNFESTLKSLKSQFDSGTKSFDRYMLKSLFFVSTGSNDFGYAFDNVHFPEWGILTTFAEFVVGQLPNHLERLYKLGARRFFINKAIPMGCIPFIAEKQQACNQTRDELVLNYNARLPIVLEELQSRLPGFQYTIGDIYTVMMDAIKKPKTYGFTSTLKSCCFYCKRKNHVCKDRNSHVFFDLAHATEAVHFLIMKRYFNEPSLCSPVDFTKFIKA